MRGSPKEEGRSQSQTPWEEVNPGAGNKVLTIDLTREVREIVSCLRLGVQVGLDSRLEMPGAFLVEEGGRRNSGPAMVKQAERDTKPGG